MNTSGMPDPLAQLKDIHLPEPIHWWPLAPGWWLVLLVIVVLICFVIYRWRRHKKVSTSIVTHLQTDFDRIQRIYRQQGNDDVMLKQMLLLMKTVAIHTYGRRKTAALTGTAWSQFLTQEFPQIVLTPATRECIEKGLYAPNIICEGDIFFAQSSQVIEAMIKKLSKMIQETPA
ncbi:MAG: DUF4381 domain-containing protein [Pseudomonadota bacterium]